jgi:heme-degrading monooxygenase HmoA
MEPRMAHMRVWKFRPPTNREEEFAAAYSADGAWAELFRTADGFLGTDLLRPAEPGGWWATIDRWQSEAAFSAFQAKQGAEYRRLDAELEGCAGKEEFVGAFEG